MTDTDYLKELLRPLGVYDVDAPFNGGELTAAGEALDGAFGALEEVERESSLLTARSWGQEGLAAMMMNSLGVTRTFRWSLRAIRVRALMGSPWLPVVITVTCSGGYFLTSAMSMSTPSETVI